MISELENLEIKNKIQLSRTADCYDSIYDVEEMVKGDSLMKQCAPFLKINKERKEINLKEVDILRNSKVSKLRNV